MQKIKELLKQIMELAYEKSENTRSKVFIDYSPHVKLISVKIYLEGWQINRSANYILETYLDTTNSIEELEKIIRKIEEIGGKE